MSPWVRRVFLSILPRLLLMPRPYPEADAGTGDKSKEYVVRSCNGIEMRQPFQGHEHDDLTTRPPVGYSYSHPSCQPYSHYSHEALPDTSRLLAARSEALLGPVDRQSVSSSTMRRRMIYSKEVMDAIDSVNFIAEHLKKEDQDSSVRASVIIAVVCCSCCLQCCYSCCCWWWCRMMLLAEENNGRTTE